MQSNYNDNIKGYNDAMGRKDLCDSELLQHLIE